MNHSKVIYLSYPKATPTATRDFIGCRSAERIVKSLFSEHQKTFFRVWEGREKKPLQASLGNTWIPSCEGMTKGVWNEWRKILWEWLSAAIFSDKHKPWILSLLGADVFPGTVYSV
jgi:hypothetical protein